MGDALVAGAVAVVVLDDASGELDVEDRELGFVGTEAPEVGVVGHRVEAAAAVGGGGVVVGERGGGVGDGAVGLTELAVEGGTQDDPVLLHAEAGELAGPDRGREHIPRQVSAPGTGLAVRARVRRGSTTGSGSSTGSAGGGTGMWISRFGSPIRPMALLGSTAHVRDHILRDVAHRVEGLLA